MKIKKISIITVCLNSEKNIRETIESVIKQTYSNVEYIIIDGKSNDNTINIISEYKKNISTFISEPDQGIYDAMNKGINISTGDIIGFINSDDTFAYNTVLEEIANKMYLTNSNILYGDLLYVKKDDITIPIRYWKSSQFTKSNILRGWMPAHPTFYATKELYQKLGHFNIKYKVSADYDLMIRFLKHSSPSNVTYIPKVLVLMKIGGKSNQSIYSRVIAIIESFKILKENGYKLFFLIGLVKPVRKLFQFIHLKRRNSILQKI